jgi:nicotinamide-nucleotide amidase
LVTAEILSIGTELLLGQIVDTNAQFVGQELAKLGIDCFFRTTVGDNKERIKGAIITALNRADIVITTGGLGPTADDLTTESIAEIFAAPLVIEQAVLSRIESFFKALNYKMPESNRKQALIPDGAHVLPNPTGTACGIIWEISPEMMKRLDIAFASSGKTIMTFPGVPRELFAMWQQTAEPYLASKYSGGFLWSCDLKHFGIGESALAERYAHLLQLENPSVAPYAGRWECRLRVTAKASSSEAAKVMAAPIIDEIMKGSGTLCYGIDSETLESVVGRLLTENKQTIAVAESCTGGLVSTRLTEIPGSSSYIKLNVVTYANEAKEKILKVPQSILSAHGAVSAECAELMAQHVMKLAESDIGLSITGIAGPSSDGSDKPVGLVYLGMATKDKYIAKQLNLPSRLGRSEIRYRSASEAINMVRLFLLEQKTAQ